MKDEEGGKGEKGKGVKGRSKSFFLFPFSPLPLLPPCFHPVRLSLPVRLAHASTRPKTKRPSGIITAPITASVTSSGTTAESGAPADCNGSDAVAPMRHKQGARSREIRRRRGDPGGLCGRSRRADLVLPPVTQFIQAVVAGTV